MWKINVPHENTMKSDFHEMNLMKLQWIANEIYPLNGTNFIDF